MSSAVGWVGFLTITLAGCTVVTSQPNAGAGGGPIAGDGATVAGGGSADAGAPDLGGSSGSGGAPIGAGGSAATAPWEPATGNLSTLKSQCGNVTYVTTQPGSDLLITGVFKLGLWSSTNGGDTWKHMGEGAGSELITHGVSSIVFDPLDPDVFWESGIYGPGVYHSEDGGKTLTLLGNDQHADLVAVDFGDADRKTLLAGGHEQSRTLNLSDDGGSMWSPVGATLPDKSNCTFPFIVNSKTYLVGCGGFGGGVSGIYRSTDSGGSWKVASTSGGAWIPLQASDGAIYWPSPYPGGLTRSTDDGKTWHAFASADQVFAVTPVELPDGRLAALSTDRVVVTSDDGAHWQPVTDALPYKFPGGLAYSAKQKSFFVWHSTCDTQVLVPEDAILRAHFDYKKE